MGVKTVYVDSSKCTSCRACEVACSMRNQGEFNPQKSRIASYVDGLSKFVCITCFQCDDPPCMAVCPVDAISKDASSGVVHIDKQTCIGCKSCVQACPYGCVTFLKDEKKSIKCELCDGNPECVAFCVQNALIFGEIDKPLQKKLRRFALLHKQPQEEVRAQ